MEENRETTAIVFYSKHHRNTQLLVDAIKKRASEVELMNINDMNMIYLSNYDLIGIASGIYFAKFAKPLMEYLKLHLPEGKKVFALYTCGSPNDKYTKEVKELAAQRHCEYLGEYSCPGYDTFGPFKLVGGVQKGHPSISEIQGAVDFYFSLK